MAAAKKPLVSEAYIQKAMKGGGWKASTVVECLASSQSPRLGSLYQGEEERGEVEVDGSVSSRPAWSTRASSRTETKS